MEQIIGIYVGAYTNKTVAIPATIYKKLKFLVTPDSTGIANLTLNTGKFGTEDTTALPLSADKIAKYVVGDGSFFVSATIVIPSGCTVWIEGLINKY